MAATMIGGAFLSATVQTLVEKLASTEFLDFIKNTKLNISLLRQLKTTLLTLQAVLDDAEEKQINNPSVKQWLDDLKDAVFDAEDLLNQISYDSLRCKMENTETRNNHNQVWNFLSSPFKNIYGEINSQMKIMCDNLQLFAQHKDILGLQNKTGRIAHRTPSSSVINESFMVGRNDDKENLMNMLLSDSGIGNNKNIGVVAILGMGGVGKTTLAQLVYNDEKVQAHFDLKAWACVSEDFDILKVTKTLLESVTSRVWESNNLDFLRVELMNILREKMFLFVLDDLWNDSYNDWYELVTPLFKGNSGSRIIITTRLQKVAVVAHTFPIHKLELLSDEDNWSLLSKHAFGSEDLCASKCSNLEEIGRKIAKKCVGLPIAAKTLGGLLRSKLDAKEWTDVLNSDIWKLPNDNILPALLLSYQYLPSQLKQCFSYCSIFPKDYPLDRKKLVLLWMTEGFLDNSQEEKAMEEVGDEFFDELLSRSLIEQLKGYSGEQKFVMHDLVNDLATVVSGKSCYRHEFGGDTSNHVLYLSYNQEMYDIWNKFNIFYKLKCLRSFLPIGSRGLWYYLSNKVLDNLLPTFGRLRVLSLSRYTNINLLSDSIGNLVQLRYLDLSHTQIKSLPDSICKLYYLQTLILSKCLKLIELPDHVGKLINLRHLYINSTGITEMPNQIVELVNLQTLTVFVVGNKEFGLSIRQLGRFSKLHGKLFIKNLHNINDAVDAFDANLKGKEHIEKLTLQWGQEADDSFKEKYVLDNLEPSTNLKKLTIDLYGGTSFPSWLGNSSFSNMVSICINNCAYCMTLPPLGQLPSLKDLSVKGMSMLKTIGPEFYGMVGESTNSSFQAFPSLEKLWFENMPNWKEWLPFQDGLFSFPRLKSMKLANCPELLSLPSHLSSIEKFSLNGCDILLETLATINWFSSIKNISIMRDVNSVKKTQCSLSKVRNTCLRKLSLSSTLSLTAFPTNGLPTSLQSLQIYKCNNISFLPPELWSNCASLVMLELTYCDALTSFPIDGFPKLQLLYLKSCNSLESIFISESSSHRPSTLQSIFVYKCDTLRSLPQRMDTLTNLESLLLFHLPKLELSLCEGAFLPSSLQSLHIHNVGTKMPPITKWGLQCLTSLSALTIGSNDDVVNTLLKRRLLPTSILDLIISNLPKMKCIHGNELRHLSSLEKLDFIGCLGLEYLTEAVLPASLETLSFNNCPRLECLPKDIPSSLKLLRIETCPMLEAKYGNGSERGEHWSDIAHIPVIEINDKVTI